MPNNVDGRMPLNSESDILGVDNSGLAEYDKGRDHTQSSPLIHAARECRSSSGSPTIDSLRVSTVIIKT